MSKGTIVIIRDGIEAVWSGDIMDFIALPSAGDYMDEKHTFAVYLQHNGRKSMKLLSASEYMLMIITLAASI